MYVFVIAAEGPNKYGKMFKTLWEKLGDQTIQLCNWTKPVIAGTPNGRHRLRAEDECGSAFDFDGWSGQWANWKIIPNITAPYTPHLLFYFQPKIFWSSILVAHIFVVHIFVAIYLWCIYLWPIYLRPIDLWSIYLRSIYLWSLYLWSIFLWPIHIKTLKHSFLWISVWNCF